MQPSKIRGNIGATKSQCRNCPGLLTCTDVCYAVGEIVSMPCCRTFLLGHCLALRMVFRWRAYWLQWEQHIVICCQHSLAEPMSFATLGSSLTYWLPG